MLAKVKVTNLATNNKNLSHGRFLSTMTNLLKDVKITLSHNLTIE